MNTRPLDEESRQLLRRIVESMAWRQIATMNILGHCLKYVVDLETKLRVATELDLSLRLFREVQSLYGELGWSHIEDAVRDRVEDVPYPGSRVEFGLAYFLTGLAERTAMEAYTESSVPEFAAIARSYVDASVGRPEPVRFLEFSADPGNRPLAQQYVERWLPIALQSLGRPGTETDKRVVSLGLRKGSVGDLQADFLELVRPFLERCGLRLPSFEDQGIRFSPTPRR